MSRVLVIIWTILVLQGLLLAGCLSGDDPVEPEDGADTDGDDSEAKGSITGEVRDEVSLEPLPDANVTLVQNNEALRATTTDDNGAYRFEDVPPGDYRLQINTLTHHSDAIGVHVEKEETRMNFLLKPYPTDDPFDQFFDFRGFMTLGLDTPVVSTTCCSNDPNHQTAFNFTIDRPDLLRTIIVEVVWNEEHVGLHADLWKNPNCNPVCDPDQEYGEGNGFGNLSFRADHEMGTWPSFDEDEITLTVQMWAERDEETATAAYQQEFHVYVQAFYVMPAQQGLVIQPDS